MTANTNTKSVEQTWKSVVLKADPDYEAERRREVEYDFRDLGGRLFATNRAKRFPYGEDA